MSYKINWCLKQSKGIKLVDVNDSISENYIKESNSDFNMIKKSNPKWRVVTSYYSCYNALYAVLVKCGIKCEIHDCSIALMGLLGFNKDDIQFMNLLKEDRINVQYYLRSPSTGIYEKRIIAFLNSCKIIIKGLDDDKINLIRKKIRDLMQ